MRKPDVDGDSAAAVATGRAAVVPLRPAVRRAVSGALLAGTFLASLEVMVVSPAMPSVVEEFGGAGLYPWVFTIYILAQTLTIPLYGWLADRWGRRNTYLLGVGLFVAGSVGCAASGSMPALVLGRAVQGLGAGALVPLTMTIFGDLYPVAERTRMQGAFSLIWGVSSLLGPPVGGWITEALSWRAIFWLNVVPGLIASAVVGALLPGWVGAGREHRRRPATATLLGDPTQQAIVLSGLMLGAVLLGVIGYLPVWVQAVGGGSPLDAGLALLPLSLAWTVAANVAGRLVHRTGFRALAVAGAWLVAAGAAVAAYRVADGFGLLLFGAGMGLTISTFTVAAQESAPLALRGSATSLTLLARSLGAAVSVPVFGWLAGIRPGAADFAAIAGLAGGVAAVFRGIALCAVLAAAIVTLRFPRRTGTDRGPATRAAVVALALAAVARGGD